MSTISRQKSVEMLTNEEVREGVAALRQLIDQVNLHNNLTIQPSSAQTFLSGSVPDTGMIGSQETLDPQPKSGRKPTGKRTATAANLDQHDKNAGCFASKISATASDSNAVELIPSAKSASSSSSLSFALESSRPSTSTSSSSSSMPSTSPNVMVVDFSSHQQLVVDLASHVTNFTASFHEQLDSTVVHFRGSVPPSNLTDLKPAVERNQKIFQQMFSLGVVDVLSESVPIVVQACLKHVRQLKIDSVEADLGIHTNLMNSINEALECIDEVAFLVKYSCECAYDIRKCYSIDVSSNASPSIRCSCETLVGNSSQRQRMLEGWLTAAMKALPLYPLCADVKTRIHDTLLSICYRVLETTSMLTSHWLMSHCVTAQMKVDLISACCQMLANDDEGVLSNYSHSPSCETLSIHCFNMLKRLLSGTHMDNWFDMNVAIMFEYMHALIDGCHHQLTQNETACSWISIRKLYSIVDLMLKLHDEVYPPSFRQRLLPRLFDMFNASICKTCFAILNLPYLDSRDPNYVNLETFRVAAIAKLLKMSKSSVHDSDLTNRVLAYLGVIYKLLSSETQTLCQNVIISGSITLFDKQLGNLIWFASSASEQLYHIISREPPSAQAVDNHRQLCLKLIDGLLDCFKQCQINEVLPFAKDDASSFVAELVTALTFLFYYRPGQVAEQFCVWFDQIAQESLEFEASSSSTASSSPAHFRFVQFIHILQMIHSAVERNFRIFNDTLSDHIRNAAHSVFSLVFSHAIDALFKLAHQHPLSSTVHSVMSEILLESAITNRRMLEDASFDKSKNLSISIDFALAYHQAILRSLPQSRDVFLFAATYVAAFNAPTLAYLKMESTRACQSSALSNRDRMMKMPMFQLSSSSMQLELLTQLVHASYVHFVRSDEFLNAKALNVILVLNACKQLLTGLNSNIPEYPSVLSEVIQMCCRILNRVAFHLNTCFVCRCFLRDEKEMFTEYSLVMELLSLIVELLKLDSGSRQLHFLMMELGGWKDLFSLLQYLPRIRSSEHVTSMTRKTFLQIMDLLLRIFEIRELFVEIGGIYYFSHFFLPIQSGRSEFNKHCSFLINSLAAFEKRPLTFCAAHSCHRAILSWLVNDVTPSSNTMTSVRRLHPLPLMWMRYLSHLDWTGAPCKWNLLGHHSHASRNGLGEIRMENEHFSLVLELAKSISQVPLRIEEVPLAFRHEQRDQLICDMLPQYTLQALARMVICRLDKRPFHENRDNHFAETSIRVALASLIWITSSAHHGQDEDQSMVIASPQEQALSSSSNGIDYSLGPELSNYQLARQAALELSELENSDFIQSVDVTNNGAQRDFEYDLQMFDLNVEHTDAIKRVIDNSKSPISSRHVKLLALTRILREYMIYKPKIVKEVIAAFQYAKSSTMFPAWFSESIVQLTNQIALNPKVSECTPLFPQPHGLKDNGQPVVNRRTERSRHLCRQVTQLEKDTTVVLFEILCRL